MSKETIALSEGTEEFNSIKEEWLVKAKEATLDTLPSLLKELTEDYQHDYGTICHAVAVAAQAAAWAVNARPQGGITGFQAGAVMWEFVRDWNFSDNKTGLKIVDYDNMLFPQDEDKFSKSISKGVWDNLQKEASEKIDKADEEYAEFLFKMVQYEKDIKTFVDKFPDYYENRDHYDPLGLGTGDQWEAEEAKKASGFEFAPQQPYEPIDKESRVYSHWQSIVSGRVPFGYIVEED